MAGVIVAVLSYEILACQRQLYVGRECFREENYSMILLPGFGGLLESPTCVHEESQNVWKVSLFFGNIQKRHPLGLSGSHIHAQQACFSPEAHFKFLVAKDHGQTWG